MPMQQAYVVNSPLTLSLASNHNSSNFVKSPMDSGMVPVNEFLPPDFTNMNFSENDENRKLKPFEFYHHHVPKLRSVKSTRLPISFGIVPLMPSSTGGKWKFVSLVDTKQF